MNTLGPFQVGALLLSASYGVGFLFGSGELALRWGMAGALYAVATAAGMLVLALMAARIWRSRLPVWELFGHRYGTQLKSASAALSLLWMGGVLAAQVRGATAVAGLIGLPSPLDLLLVLLAIGLLSRLPLRAAATASAVGLLAATAVLLLALADAPARPSYGGAWIAFTQDLSDLSAGRVALVVLAVATLVVTGADYQQFVLAARSRRAAAWGCVLAALALAGIALLPAALVVAQGPVPPGGTPGAGIVPQILAQTAARFGAGAAPLMLAALMAAALGSGAAVARSMADAITSLRPTGEVEQPRLALVLALLAGALVASRGQAIVETMVSLNIVYLASVGLAWAALHAGPSLSPPAAQRAVACGFAVSFAAYAAGWAGWLPGDADADAVSLLAGLAASVLAAHAVQAGECRRRSGVCRAQVGAGPC